MEAEQLFDDAFLSQKLKNDSELEEFYFQEKLILEVTELVASLMEKKGINKTELARRLGKGKSYITQLLDGTSNMTLRTIADVFVALDSMLIVNSGTLSLECTQSHGEYEFNEGAHGVASEISLPDLVGQDDILANPDRMVA